MRGIILSIATLAVGMQAMAQQVKWVQSTQTDHWTINQLKSNTNKSTTADVEILTAQPKQSVNGFGGCFNELGWTSLQLLSDKYRKDILKELFAPNVGANFTICRMPVWR